MSIISVFQNEYNGTIPPEILAHKKLESLNLAGNNLSGSIPFAPSSQITSLEIGHNQLSGQLPTNIDELLPSVKVFDLSNNKLSGTIPSSFGNIEPLDFFDISANGLGEKSATKISFSTNTLCS